jgi:hypothetical protein
LLLDTEERGYVRSRLTNAGENGQVVLGVFEVLLCSEVPVRTRLADAGRDFGVVKGLSTRSRKFAISGGTSVAQIRLAIEINETG